ncbi:MAG: NAD(P)/FAD-dependent oxidoreductase [Reyranellaceae bacterium]
MIVGGGQAGIEAAMSLRGGGYQEPIRLLTGEAFAPYQRPPLSKDVLLGRRSLDRLGFVGPEFYEKNGIALHISCWVDAIERPQRRVVLRNGERHAYDHLVLATGAQARRLSRMPAGVTCLRTLDDAAILAKALDEVDRLIVVGGGFIGLEVAASAHQRGKSVTVLEKAGRLMERVASPAMAQYFLDLHRNNGVAVRLGVELDEWVRSGSRLDGMKLATGELVPARLAVVGIGVNVDGTLAASAGLEFDDGILVDAQMRTSDPCVYAIGDCARHYNRHAGAVIRLESVQNAVDQAQVAAANIMGKERHYDSVPWFWTDQYGAKLQIAGFPAASSLPVLRGDPATGGFSVFHFAGGGLVAAESVNRPADHMAARRILARQSRLAPEQAADPSFDLRKMA